MSFVSHYLLREPVLSLLLIFFFSAHSRGWRLSVKGQCLSLMIQDTTSPRNVLLFSSLDVPGQEGAFGFGVWVSSHIDSSCFPECQGRARSCSLFSFVKVQPIYKGPVTMISGYGIQVHVLEPVCHKVFNPAPPTPFWFVVRSNHCQ